jgi:hypothetical protein
MGGKITVGLIHGEEILKDIFKRFQCKIEPFFWIFQFFRRFQKAKLRFEAIREGEEDFKPLRPTTAQEGLNLSCYLLPRRALAVNSYTL